MQSSDQLLAYIREGKTLTRGNMLSLIVALSIPSILAQVSQVLMFFIDASMVGHLGTEASAAIGLVDTSTWLLGSLTGAASTGFSVQVAHFVGANDFSQARRVFRHGLVCCLILSSVIAIVGVGVSWRLPFWLGGGADIAHDATLYFLIWAAAMPFFQMEVLGSAMLKSTGDMRTPSVVNISMCLLDVVFNYLFIYLLNLGVAGAAIGSACAIICGAITLLYIAIFRNKILALRHSHEPFQWEPAYVSNALKISAPIALQSTLMSGAQIVSTKIVAPLGNVAIAANTFAITAESLCYMPGYGIGDAATTLVGQSVGAQRPLLCRSFAKMTVGMGMLVMAVMGVVMYIFAPEMMAVLSPVEAIKDLGAQVLRIEAFAEPFFAAAIVTYSVCVGAGDTVKPAIMNLVSMWGVRLTLAWLLAQNYGLVGVWVAMATELTFRGVIFLIRLFKGKWLTIKVKR